MGRVAVKLTSAYSNPVGLQVHAESPSFSATVVLSCEIKALTDFGRKIKGFPKSAGEQIEFALGAGKGKGKAEFLFLTVGAGVCELWIRLTAPTDDAGKTAEAHFLIDYLEPTSIDAFARELVNMGVNQMKIAELKNRFEKS